MTEITIEAMEPILTKKEKSDRWNYHWEPDDGIHAEKVGKHARQRAKKTARMNCGQRPEQLLPESLSLAHRLWNEQ